MTPTPFGSAGSANCAKSLPLVTVIPVTAVLTIIRFVDAPVRWGIGATEAPEAVPVNVNLANETTGGGGIAVVPDITASAQMRRTRAVTVAAAGIWSQKNPVAVPSWIVAE